MTRSAPLASREDQQLLDTEVLRDAIASLANAADRGLDAGGGQALGVFDRDILGEFKRSSQQSRCWLIEAIGQAPLPAFAKQASFGALC